MGTDSDMNEVHLEFHQMEQHAPLTTQPKKHDDALTHDGPVVAVPPKFGYKPAQIVCPKCHQRGTTNLVYHITDFSLLSSFLCSLATWPCCLCCLSGIPYCLGVCQKAEHLCPHCNAQLGSHAQFKLSKIWSAATSPCRCSR